MAENLEPNVLQGQGKANVLRGELTFPEDQWGHGRRTSVLRRAVTGLDAAGSGVAVGIVTSEVIGAIHSPGLVLASIFWLSFHWFSVLIANPGNFLEIKPEPK